jgi:hypothetical protein
MAWQASRTGIEAAATAKDASAAHWRKHVQLTWHLPQHITEAFHADAQGQKGGEHYLCYDSIRENSIASHQLPGRTADGKGTAKSHLVEQNSNMRRSRCVQLAL